MRDEQTPPKPPLAVTTEDAVLDVNGALEELVERVGEGARRLLGSLVTLGAALARNKIISAGTRKKEEPAP